MVLVLEFRSSCSSLPIDGNKHKWVRSELRREGCTFNTQILHVNHSLCPAAVLPPLNPSSWGWRAVVSPKSISVSSQENTATWRVTCYLIPAPVEAVDMLRGVCVNGFCSISLGFDVGSGFLGWGQAALFVCSHSSADKRGVYHQCRHQAHSMQHSVLCVCESCSGRLLCDQLGKDTSFLAEAGVLLPGFVAK